MTLLAYAVRRTIGAVIVLLVVMLLTMFAVAMIGPFGLESGPADLVRIDEARGNLAEAWEKFPAQGLALLGLVAVASLAWRLAARRD